MSTSDPVWYEYSLAYAIHTIPHARTHARTALHANLQENVFINCEILYVLVCHHLETAGKQLYIFVPFLCQSPRRCTRFKMLGIPKCNALSSEPCVELLWMVCDVMKSHTETTLKALSKLDFGPEYNHCCWQTKGDTLLLWTHLFIPCCACFQPWL